jgi:hypothetical protein
VSQIELATPNQKKLGNSIPNVDGENFQVVLSLVNFDGFPHLLETRSVKFIKRRKSGT